MPKDKELTYDYNYTHNSQTPNKCIYCNNNITTDEFEYEDYYVLFRGHGPDAYQGYICFNCNEFLSQYS